MNVPNEYIIQTSNNSTRTECAEDSKMITRDDLNIFDDDYEEKLHAIERRETIILGIAWSFAIVSITVISIGSFYINLFA